MSTSCPGITSKVPKSSPPPVRWLMKCNGRCFHFYELQKEKGQNLKPKISIDSLMSDFAPADMHLHYDVIINYLSYTTFDYDVMVYKSSSRCGHVGHFDDRFVQFQQNDRFQYFPFCLFQSLRLSVIKAVTQGASEQTPETVVTVSVQLGVRVQEVPIVCKKFLLFSEHLLTEPKLEACVRTCRQGYYPVNSTCKECDGPCPKTCKAAEFSNNGLDIVSNISIDLYKNCTIIEGNLKIVEATFNGDPHLKIPGLTIDQLDVFKTVKEITGYLMVQSNVENLTSLSFLSNLTVIHGRELDSAGSAFSVMNTHFKSLEMISLKRIENGRIILYKNKNLCYIQDNNFLSLYPESKKRSDLVMLRSNKPADRCRAEGEVCDLSCSDDGCWGKGPNKCLSCRTYKIDNSSNICIDSCSRVPRLYDSGNRLCKFCDEECLSGCTGAGPEKCDKCKHFELRGSVNGTEIVRCLAECPPYYYPDQNNVCHKCHPFCDEGCTGPSYEVKRGGCNTCALAIEIISPNGILITSCQDPDTEKCDHGYFRSTKPHLNLNSTRRMPVCVQCHPMCDGCYEAGASQCMECRHVKQDELCAEKCVSYAYPDDDNICQPCNAQCSGGCFGPTSADCNACLNKKIYLDKPDPDSGLLPIPEHCINSTEVCRRDFNCTKECPPNLQYLVQDMEAKEEAKTVCADENYKAVRAMLQNNEDAKKKQLMYIIFGTIGGVLLLGFILLVFGYFWKQRAKSQEKTAILTAKMTGYGEDEPVTPTDAKPDMSSLRLIKESELRRGGIIGSGAFGTVYKGFWIPSNEHVKIPVAIKVLQEGTSPNQNKELLEEARVMASVEHPCCIRILAVCMTAQMMLITQLMPLGCLLDYVRKHKDNIGSKVLLNWCTQIAKGMAYLEERGIVHRDLAARNVLVQSPGQIKITDFGLAKLLDYNEDEYHASGGKMPIKWLALECIQHRIFTHKSDVWSYGVTVWELLTYGQRPYENVRARDVPDLLEKGERLSQPPVCTIDVYMIMIKCWMLDADSRPKFTELAEEFAKMARDPGRYLVIAGDKLMRLPSHSYDKNDLARSLSVAADSPEEVMEAEEYLQPTPRHSMEPPTTPVSSKTPLLPSIQPYGEAAHAREVKDHARPQPRREKRYGHLESAAAARQQRLDPGRMRGDSINSRYSSDPVKVIHFDEADGNPFRNGSVGAADRRKNYPSVAKKDYKQLALDEDNYLQPSSTKPQAYTDIIDGPDYLNDSSVFIESPNQQYVQHDPQALNFQNPEYFDDVSASPQNVPNKNFFNSPHSNNNGFHSNSNRSKDYYNDLAMKKSPELKPLIISEDNSETTV
ncbi:hypothetical protein FSP39_001823 [Pinctada imbricata]|uniref:Protein kinase domain-containing protein n=1 Tax=Pinctada imbricata TaxID=66713 RepID=A0AA88XKF9_PINIB|nr:hypothetical protein FSP39_001823 [Pinctada imbricata]